MNTLGYNAGYFASSRGYKNKRRGLYYDRIIITNPAVSDFSGEYGVFRYDFEYRLTYDETIDVSEHYPVYAVFW